MRWVAYSDGYEVSSDGHIRNSETKRILHEYVGKDGYLRTQFDGKTRLIHRVVAETFLENNERLREVNHISGNKLDNSITNLEWCTRNHNLKHAYDNGLRTAKGEHNSRCKLLAADVKFIKENYIPGDKKLGAKALSTRFGVAPQTISAARCGQNWKDIE